MSASTPNETVGYETLPDRPPLVTALLVVVVIALSTSAAHLFRESAFWVMERFGESHDATAAARHLPAVATFAVVFAAVMFAAWVGCSAVRRYPGRAGLEAIAATAAGQDRNISTRATAMRTLGTWVMTVGLVPIGREAAIIETGGAIGSGLARRFRGRGAAMATAGIAAAFATAYHAPLAAIVYVEEHLRVRGSRRATAFTVCGAVGGFLLAVTVFDTRAVLPITYADWRDQLAAGAIVVVPAALAARLFLEVRSRLAALRTGRVITTRFRLVTALAGATLAGLMVACWPRSAGNGMDVLRHIAPSTQLVGAVVVAMLVAKLVGTSAVFATGAPGGALTPTIVIGAGGALALAMAVSALGWGTPDIWTMVVLAGAVAVAVSLRAPLTAVVLLPELTGRYSLVPACAVAVALAVGLDRVIDLGLRSRLRGAAAGAVFDEDG
ncbi:MAG: chloride channel protein [Actinomycetota bacterium]|nr:chloride channel protein [Actinomycetota bacterium]